MGRFDTTKAMINANIKKNGNQEITGSILNSVMTEMVDATDSELAKLSDEIKPLADNISDNSNHVIEESIEIEDSKGDILVKITPSEIDIKKMRLVGENIGIGASPLTGKKIYICGDSIIKGYPTIPESERLYSRIASLTGASVTSLAENGSLFVYPHPTSPTRSILYQLQRVPADADYILVEGGVNGTNYDNPNGGDYYPLGKMTESYTTFDTSEQIGCLEEICKYLTQNLAGKKVGIIVPFQIKAGYTQYVSYWKPKAEAFIEVLKKWGVPYMDWRQSGVNLSANAEFYGIDTWESYEEFSISKAYAIDDKVLYDGNAYKANTAISPGAWDATQWTKIGNRYDTWHPNSLGYAILADKTCAWLKTL